MSERNNFTLDVISDIDEEIIDKNLKKRFVLWSKKSKRRNSHLISLIASAACFCIIVSAIFYATYGGVPLRPDTPPIGSMPPGSVPPGSMPPGSMPPGSMPPGSTPIVPDNRQIPIYQGMTVSTEAPTTNVSPSASRSGILNLSALQNKTAGTLLLDNSNGNNGNHYGNDKDSSSSVPEDSTTPEDSTPLEDSTTPEVFGGTYYALKNEDIYIHVHLSNPDDFEILSFTLNGVKYSSNMFEYGSNLELLILKYNVGDVKGLQEYTIDAIKYIDGETIKDARMDGDRTVKVYVNDDTQPLDLCAQQVGFDLMIAPTWADDFTGDKVITSLSLWKDDEKLSDLDTDTTEISDLPSGERLILKATYLGTDGEEKLLQYVFDTPKQSEGLAITDGVVTGIGTCRDSVLYIDMPVGDNAFFRCQYIKKVYFGNGATSIGYYAFGEAVDLETVELSKMTSVLGDRSFEGCQKLKLIDLSHVKYVGEGALGLNSNLEVVFGDSLEYYNGGLDFKFTSTEYAGGHYIGSENNPYVMLYKIDNGIDSVTIHENTRIIYGGVFYENKSLTSITLPEGITSIVNSAFGDCSNLISITLPSTLKYIGWGAFSGCSGLQSLTVPDSVVRIDHSAFDGCGNISEFKLGAGLEEIGRCAFIGCDSLEEVTIPSNVRAIEFGAFANCFGLRSVTIESEEGLTIDEATFSDCSALESVFIPECIDFIHENAFQGCENATVYVSAESIPGVPTGWEANVKEVVWGYTD